MSIMNLTLLALLGACGSDDVKDETTTTTETTDDWWDVESEDSGDTDDGSDETTKDDTGKDDYYAITSGVEATVLTDLSGGEIAFNHAAAGGKSCVIGADLSDITPVKDCAECSFAMSMTVGATEITKDSGGCEDDEAVALLNSEGAVLVFGQETTEVGEYQGIVYYELQQQVDGTWGRSAGGYSAVVDDAGKEQWFFGTK